MKESHFSKAPRQRAFTLFEILVACAIVMALAGISIPAVVRAKSESRKAVSLSNLRNCGVALLLYCEEYEGVASVPVRPSADQVLRTMPTCDSGDYFRPSCQSPSPAPMIGSYAYVRDPRVYGDEESWRHYLSIHTESGYSPALLINLFVSTKKHVPSLWFGPFPIANPHPDRIQVFEADGGVRLYRPKSRPDIGYTWHTLFLKR